MSNEKPNPPMPATPEGAKQGANPAPPVKAPAAPLPPLFRRIDWLTFLVTWLTAFIAYQFTLSPDLTLQDSGELAVGSFYAGVPHPPGYPVWTIYTWLATVLFPVANIAYRVAVACSLTASLACGLLGLLVSRGSSMIVEGMADLRSLDRRLESAICVVSGFVAGCLLAFNGFYWSQAIIVEVYCFGVFSFMIVLCCLMRWLYAPNQYRYLYMAALVFGICFTNHQTLLVATMGIEVAILVVKPRLGRDIFCFNSIIYLLGLVGKLKGYVAMFDTNVPLFVIYNSIGIWSIYTTLWNALVTDRYAKFKIVGAHLAGNILIWSLWAMKRSSGGFSDNTHTLLMIVYNGGGAVLIYLYHWLSEKAERMFTEWKPLTVVVLAWCLGAGFYFYMPVTSMTNPPMNWGYPRTYDGFKHALTRGQYERTNPTSDPVRFVNQLRMYTESAVEEFNMVYLLVALVPFFFLGRMQKRERSWLTGLGAIWACLGLLLLILLNPSTDKQSRDLNKVFFNASYALISIGVGYGLTLLLSHLALQYQKYRTWLLYGVAGAAGIALYALANTIWEISYPILVYAHVFSLGLAVAFILALFFARNRAPMVPILALTALMPAYSAMTHWSENEQFGHLFGFWFGHDMFTPPDFGRKGELYPEMTKNAILFGGTDPGRFCPTYMIFCESFIPPQKRRDPNFDRRDVYIITQNALADGTYLNYIRAHYNRSTQIDPPFFQELFRTQKESESNLTTNLLARMVSPLDTFFLGLGKKIEDARRRDGVYPPKEIYTPSPEDSKRCFEEYIGDAQRRLAANQLKPGEDVRVVDNRVQVSGQVSVMQINGLLTKVIFDQNPTNEFFVEESFPLDWMYPYLTPFGIILKLNRQTVPEFTEEILKKDHLFWSLYSDRLIGNWIDYDTPVKDICAFAERVYRRMDYTGFKGEPKFVRDNDAQKAFSKLRSAIAGLYSWRINAAKSGSPEQTLLIKEAEFAFKQAFAFCPYSPEAVFRYVNMLATLQRFDDAIMVAQTCQRFDPENKGVSDLVAQLMQIRSNVHPNTISPMTQLQQMEQQFNSNPANVQLAQSLAGAFNQMQQTARANEFLDKAIAALDSQYKSNPANHSLAIGMAQLLVQRQKSEEAAQLLDLVIGRLEPEVRTNSQNVAGGLLLAQTYVQRQKNNEAAAILDKLLQRTNNDSTFLIGAAQLYAQLGNVAQLEMSLTKLVRLVPDNPEAWYDLSALQAMQGKNTEALQSLTKSIALHRKRAEAQPGAKDLATIASQDPRFNALKQNPEFVKLFQKN